MAKRKIQVSLGDRFDLPYLGKDTFRSLMRSGLNYVSRDRKFYVDVNTDVEAVNDALSDVDLEIVMVISCVHCGRAVNCPACEYSESCKRKGHYCICSDCLQDDDAYRDYVESSSLAVSA